MAGAYASARPYLLAGLYNVKALWASVVAANGQSFDADYYNAALSDLRQAELYVSP
jgi:hypothetical protein